MKYLVFFKAPCVVSDEMEVIEAIDDKDACRIAWELSCGVNEYVMMSYDVYRIGYDFNEYKHTIEQVDESILWAAWNGEDEE